MSAGTQNILLVEDDENDVFLMNRAITKANLHVSLQNATNGREAIEYLSGLGKFADRTAYPLPSSVFLDLKLPFVHGFEVLEWIRKQPTLENVNVFILTSSPEERDRQRARELGVKGYLVKPPTPQILQEVLGQAPK